MEVKTKREEIIELVHKLFVYTDSHNWSKLMTEVFKENVYFDMESMGGPKGGEITSKEICEMWKAGFQGIDHVHHHAGNFIVNFSDDDITADVFCYATATHYKKNAKSGNTREFVGSYQLHASLTDLGWRLDAFKYNLKFSVGNLTLN